MSLGYSQLMAGYVVKAKEKKRFAVVSMVQSPGSDTSKKSGAAETLNVAEVDVVGDDKGAAFVPSCVTYKSKYSVTGMSGAGTVTPICDNNRVTLTRRYCPGPHVGSLSGQDHDTARC